MIDPTEEDQSENIVVEPSKPSLSNHPTVAFSVSFSSDSTTNSISPPPTSAEIRRDQVLEWIAGKISHRIALVVVTLIIVDGALFFFLLIGAHAMCNTPSRFNCDPRNYWYNFSIQFLNVNISYLAIISLPWKLAHAVHLSCSPRSCEVGLNLYGQPTEEIWFHIPPNKRRVIVGLLVVNSFAQYTNQTMRIIYSTYERQSTFPGNLLTSVFFFTSFSCAIVAAIRQLHAEGAIRKAQPGRFPPGPLTVAKRYIRSVFCPDRQADDEEESEESEEEFLEHPRPIQEREVRERRRFLSGLRNWLRTDRTSLDMWGL